MLNLMAPNWKANIPLISQLVKLKLIIFPSIMQRWNRDENLQITWRNTTDTSRLFQNDLDFSNDAEAIFQRALKGNLKK